MIMANENIIELRTIDQLDNRLFDTKSTVTIMADGETLRAEFIVFGSILTIVLIILLITIAAFTIYVRHRRPSLPSSPIPPSPPESIRTSKAAFVNMDEENGSIYEPIGSFSPLSVSNLHRCKREEEFTEIL